MSQPTKAPMSTLDNRATANPRRTTLASVEDFAQLPGAVASQQPREYTSELPGSTANPRRTQLMVAPAPRLSQD
ncbi:hypothetical protein BX265_2415 [Streptomyces sp. TLI_235]|nr:hypothetical protein [Streptomyces sp. TLI_235]PBC77659.1 hypothetical protein BX265_2415 [Streptomyces sp. TLI_235]